VVGEQLAVVKVPDPRLDWLYEHYKPKKYTEATIDCLDVPGFSHETAQQHAEFRKSLPAIRQSDALVAVVDQRTSNRYRPGELANGTMNAPPVVKAAGVKSVTAAVVRSVHRAKIEAKPVAAPENGLIERDSVAVFPVRLPRY